MNNIVLAVQYFSSEVLLMIDAGITINMDEFVQRVEDDTIIDYVHELCPHKNINISPENMNVLRSALCNMDISLNGGRDRRIETNGLVYLESCLMDILINELYDASLIEEV